jgi:hypothetical protein
VDKTGNQVRQSHQAKLSNQPTGRIDAPPRVPPALGQECVEAVLDPPIAPVEESPHIRLAIEVPPAANDGIDPRDQFPSFEGSLPPREGSNLILEALHGLLTGDSIEVAGVGPTSAPVSR